MATDPVAQANESTRLSGQADSCRAGCAACCIAPSISSPIPGMPEGKPAGVRCVQLDDNNFCLIFGTAERPKVCESLQPSREMCGESSSEALQCLAAWEEATRPH